MENKDFTFSFESAKPLNEIFETLLDVRKWWIGIFNETISGSSKKLNDEFVFKAGDGVHHTEHRLIELEPNKKVTWLTTKSNLSFVTKTDEWTNTKFGFEITQQGNKHKITFTHEGLVPKFECYEDCSGGWTLYLKKLAETLK